METRHDWRGDEVRTLHDLPLFVLLDRAREVHRAAWGEPAVQLCQLLSIKTGGCSEDCGYCPQSARHATGVAATPLLPVGDVLARAREARAQGATRFCMGAAWRSPKGRPFEEVLDMVRGVRALGLEACCTLGMLTDAQAAALADAGLTAYNHNLDSSAAFYERIVTTRTFEDRLQTLARVEAHGISVCCGGIVGMGETVDDRCELLRTLANRPRHPESVPVNALVAVPGTPLEGREPIDTVAMVRTIAVARILMPRSVVRLSAGRERMSEEAQLLCFLAGANSVFFGEKLLTTGNPAIEADFAMFRRAGIRPLVPDGVAPGPVPGLDPPGA